MAKSTDQLMLEKIDQLLRVTTIGVTQGLKQREQIALLNRAGFQPNDIVSVLGTTRNTVSVALTGLRKAKDNPSKGRKTRGAKR